MTNKNVTNKDIATRRSVLVTAGAALSLPLAVGASTLEPVAASTGDHAKSIRGLQQALAREINEAGEINRGRGAELFASGKWPSELAGVTRLLPADFGEQDTIEMAADGRTAHATLHCAVETQLPIAAQGTLIEMARAQGEGFVRATACTMLDMVCVRDGATWKIQTLVMRG